MWFDEGKGGDLAERCRATGCPSSGEDFGGEGNTDCFGGELGGLEREIGNADDPYHAFSLVVETGGIAPGGREALLAEDPLALDVGGHGDTTIVTPNGIRCCSTAARVWWYRDE